MGKSNRWTKSEKYAERQRRKLLKRAQTTETYTIEGKIKGHVYTEGELRLAWIGKPGIKIRVLRWVITRLQGWVCRSVE